jgi:hypothetical protein
MGEFNTGAHASRIDFFCGTTQSTHQITTMEEESPTRSPEVQRHLEIVGLHASTNGRSCSVHSCCGDFLKVGDLLRLQKCVVTTNGELQDAIKCVRIIDGADSCTAAFVPRSMVKNVKIETKLDTFVQVLELYDDSENSHKRRKSHQNKGMAGCIFLAAIPEAV